MHFLLAVAQRTEVWPQVDVFVCRWGCDVGESRGCVVDGEDPSSRCEPPRRAESGSDWCEEERELVVVVLTSLAAFSSRWSETEEGYSWS